MPEIAEVRTVAKVLNKSLVGKKVTNIDFIYNKIIDEDLDTFKNHVIGSSFLSVSNFGKYLIFNLGKYSIISHLRMEGKYFIKGASDPIEKHEHIIFSLDDGNTLRYHDTRKFGRMFTCETSKVYETKELSKLGYEPNDKKLTKEFVYNKIHHTTSPIKPVLLDQTVINGLGNIYVDEVLFASSIMPNRACNLITLDECDKMIKEAKRITDKATELGGTTIRSYTSSLGVTGSYQDYLQVHTKVGLPCPKCGSTILKTRVGGRGTYYCPKCQK